VGREREGKREEGAYPDVEVEVLVGYGFDVEAYGWYCRDYLADLVCWSVLLFDDLFLYATSA
jgi:hypothetical protein